MPWLLLVTLLVAAPSAARDGGPPPLATDSLARAALAEGVLALAAVPDSETVAPVLPADLAPADTARSPLDTLAMSVWERVWWGRRGVMRRTGLFPTHPEAPMDDLRQIARVRRRMLSWHQTLGLVTVASMGVTVAGGVAASLDAGGGLHEASLPVTIGLYATTAALSLLSPPKPIRLDGRAGWDSITVHRWLAVAHVAGMVLTPLLSDDGRATHQALGIATFATFSAAMITVTLLRR